MTLIITILISILAASITMVVVRSTVLSTRTESVRTDFARASELAAAAQSDFERRLAADPVFYYKNLFGYERPRKCLSSTDPRWIAFPWVVPNSDPTVTGPEWPSDCGNKWVYPQVGQGIVGWDPINQPVRAEVSPNPDDDTVTLTVAAISGDTETGLRVTYGRQTVATWSLYSGSDLNLGAVLHPDAKVDSVGLGSGTSAYAGGVLRLPTEGVDLANTRLAAEGGFVGKVGTDGVRLLTGQVGASDPVNYGSQLGMPGVSSLRSSVPVPLTSSGLRASIPALQVAACPDGAPSNVASSDTVSAICLLPGHSVIPAASTADPSGAALQGVSVPDNVSAWLVVPDNSNPDSPRLRIFYSTTPPVNQDRCVFSGCDPTGTASLQSPLPSESSYDDTTKITTPSSQDGKPWHFLVSSKYPASGVLQAGNDVFVGRCPASTTTVCGQDSDDSSLTEPAGGWTFTSPITIVAGTDISPANLWVSGPVRSSWEVTGTDGSVVSRQAVGLVATGQVIIPISAAPNGGTVPIEAQVVAMGSGNDSSNSNIQGWPTGDIGRSMKLSVVGSLAGANLGPINGVSSINVSSATPPGQRVISAPLLPGFAQAPMRLSQQRIGSLDLCGDSSGTFAVSGITTCAGIW